MAMLDGLGILDYLSDSEKAQLEIFCQEKFMQPGEILFKEGDEANAMYFLKEGKVEISKNVKGTSTKLGVIEAEDILGEMALFGSSSKRMATAKIKKETVLITILSFSIKELTNKHPILLEKIKEIIEARNYENKISESKVR
ncbi:cyclic nucleotide-binding domain-containing protein [Candidatus Gracilibacteria bacterium]|nr:cyclic nucleotide-binding domain-containing protein [Candidatus Gracilibacteria bacterium]